LTWTLRWIQARTFAFRKADRQHARHAPRVAQNSDCRPGAPPAILINSMGHPPRIPVWLRWDQTVIYFVTICVTDRKPVLANKEAFNAFKLAASKLEHWCVLAAILMPDHLHVIVAPTIEREAKLGNFSAALKR
jgi:hypothetical protein